MCVVELDCLNKMGWSEMGLNELTPGQLDEFALDDPV